VIDTLTCTHIARQRVGKRVPPKTNSLANSPLLCYATIDEAVFLCLLRQATIEQRSYAISFEAPEL
jgi:hypothetical protein